jgi:hypothetical protein
MVLRAGFKKNLRLYVELKIYDKNRRKITGPQCVKTIKLTIKPVGHHHPQSSSLQHVHTSPTASSIFGKLPGSHFLSQCQALSAIRPGSLQWYQTGVLSASISFLEKEEVTGYQISGVR